jgi:hypothetical protein
MGFEERGRMAQAPLIANAPHPVLGLRGRRCRRPLADQVNPAVLLARGLQSAHRYRCRRETVMRPLLSRYRYRTGFVLRRVDKAAGEINAFLIAAAFSLGMLDLAYTVEKLVAALPPR